MHITLQGNANKFALWGLLWDRVHRPQPSNLSFYKEIRLDRKAYYELLIGLLQRPARDPVCRGQPAYGHFTGFIVGIPSPIEAAGEKTELDAKPPLGAPLLILPRGDLLKSFTQEDTSARQRGLKSVFSLSLVCWQWLSGLACKLASYTAGNSFQTSRLCQHPNQ